MSQCKYSHLKENGWENRKRRLEQKQDSNPAAQTLNPVVPCLSSGVCSDRMRSNECGQSHSMWAVSLGWLYSLLMPFLHRHSTLLASTTLWGFCCNLGFSPMALCITGAVTLTLPHFAWPCIVPDPVTLTVHLQNQNHMANVKASC